MRRDHVTERRVASALQALLVLLCCATAQAQTFPSKPIRVIVPSVAGGATDITARMIAPKMSEFLDQQVVVENRAGAAMIIGSEAVASAAADGHTRLMGVIKMGTKPFLYKKLPYDTVRDFAPSSQSFSLPNVLVVHPAVPARTVRPFAVLAKSRPGSLAYGSAGVGSSLRWSMVFFENMTGIHLSHVPYKGSAPAALHHLAARPSNSSA